ncbi:MAG: hypothetical protein Kow00108_19400 [Calditrichia bacterium]
MKRLMFFSLLTFIVLIFASCTKESDDIPTFQDYETLDRLVEKGYEHLQNRKYQEALDAFLAANQRDVSDTRAYDGLGWSYLMLNENAKALGSFNTLSLFAADESTKKTAQIGMAFAYFYNGDYEMVNPIIQKYVDDTFEFSHPNVTYITKEDVMLLGAGCYLEENRLDSVAVFLNMIDNNFISGMVNDMVLTRVEDTIMVEDESQIDAASGMVAIPIDVAGEDLGSPQVMFDKNLVLVNAIEITGNVGVTKVVKVDFVEKQVQIFSNPIPSTGMTYAADYYVANNFNQFKNQLLTTLESLMQQYQN